MKRNNLPNSPQLLAFIAFAAFGILYAVFGGIGRAVVLKNNQCKMTYTSRDRRFIPVRTTVSGYQLWKYSNHRSKRLNKQPVLFIPGHRGTVDQVRSLSSTMHNDDSFFQYFSLDFKESDSAHHGSSILTQAVFVNDAVEKINILYRSMNPKEPVPKVMLVGHSIGGMVARTSVVLDNHPKCAVSDIILLSSPSLRPPYSLDSSMDALYGAVNKAWANSFLNESKPCRISARVAQSELRQYAESVSEYANNAVTKKKEGEDSAKSSQHVAEEDERVFADRKIVFNNSELITADWNCPVCAAKIRMISIAGGDIDNLVPAALTRLEALAPLPRNLTLERGDGAPSQSGPADKKYMLFSVLQGPMGIISAIMKMGYSLVAGKGTAAAPRTVNNDTEVAKPDNASDAAIEATAEVVTSDISSGSCSGENGTCAASTAADAASTEASTVQRNFYETVTVGAWQADMAPYIEALHLSVRSSQLQSVGFAVDHTAILWCYQLVSAVTSAMRTLARTPYSESDLATMSGLFPTKNEYKLNYTEAAGPEPSAVGAKYIQPIANLLIRNTSRAIWDLAATGEIAQLQQGAPFGAIQAIAIDFISNHLVKIAICYVMISCLCLSVPLFRALSDNKKRHFSGGIASEFELLMPWQHWHLAILDPALHAVVCLVLPTDLSEKIVSPISVLASLAALVIVPKGIFDFFSPTLFHLRYGPIFHWIAAYGLALTVKAILIPIVHFARIVASLFAVIVIFLLRWTVWNKYVRRAFRRTTKYLNKHIIPKLGLPKYLFSLQVIGSSVAVAVVLAGMVIGGMNAWSRVSGPNASLTFGTLLVCLSSISLAVVATLALLLSLLFPPESADEYSHHTQLVQLLLPMPLLVAPTVMFSYSLLYGSPETFASATPLFEIFGPERLNFLICLTAIATHLFVSRGSDYSRIQKVEPIAWLTEMFGPSIHSPYYAGVGGASFAGGKGSTKAGPCVHEDGGRFAVFESTEGDPNFDVVDLSPGVTLGTKYRVIYCACYRDTTLKDRSEWCEFCRCKHCGGRFAPKDKEEEKAMQRRGADGPINDFSPDLGLLIGLLGLAAGAVVYSGDCAYKHLYLMGMVCFAYSVRDFCCGMMSTLSEFVKA